jgi:molybdenum cofactor cytidylyltransferase
VQTFGLIPAAGKSERMGRPKLLLPVDGKTVLEHVLTAVRDGGVAKVLVVVGPHARALQEAAERAGAYVLQLAADTADMRETCQRGLDWLESMFHPRADDGWLLMPADHPTCRPEVVRALLDAVRHHPDRSILVPIHDGKRGHPVWLRWDHLPAIRALPASEGLNAFIRAQVEQTLELPWASAEILRDLDTPDDYRRLLADGGE